MSGANFPWRGTTRTASDVVAQTRVAQLARKCNEGELTTEKRDEYRTYVTAGELIAILQAQSRVLLAGHSQTA